VFASLRGTLESKSAGSVIVDVHGVGYLVQIPLSTFYHLGEVGDPVHLRITTWVREDAIQLFGFLTAGEQELFRHLTSVTGVGPRIAVAVLSGLSVEELARALVDGDAKRLQRIPGIGRKTAERLVLELRDRVRPPESPDVAETETEASLRDDVVSALVNLGYPSAQAQAAAEEAEKGTAGPSAPPGFPDILRRALRLLQRP